MTNKKVTDYHEFNIWRYEDDTVELYCGRDGEPVDPYLAFLEANVVSRSIGETLQESDEVFSMSAYDNGVVSTRWRGDTSTGERWQRFRWTKERLNEAGYNGLLGYRRPPRWVMLTAWALEFLLVKFTTKVWGPPVKEEQYIDEPDLPADWDMTNVINLADKRR
jgi:hypothetical protein